MEFTTSHAFPTFDEHQGLWGTTSWPPITRECFDRMCHGPNRFACVRDDRLVAMARLVTDGVLYGYIQDVIVLEPYRRRGIGRLVVGELLNHAAYLKLRFVGLFSTLDAQDFYYKLGFTSLSDVNVGLGKYL